jgi:DNA ligase D-like protein (predicted 3'-phosphoesterase)
MTQLSIRNNLLSKRAKVTSDKPAYQKKEKSESGNDIYRYDEKHIEKRWKEKKEKLKKLEKELDKVRKQYRDDLKSDDERTRAIAAIVGIMDDTAMRIGNEESAKEGTFGASTLKVKHVKGGSGKMTFDFPGKGSIEQNVTLENNEVIKAIRDLMKGKKSDDFIFEVDGKKIWDRAVNRYLKPMGISAKDLRGFHSNRLMKEMLKKKDWKEALEEVAEIVGHKASTLKNQYLDPELVEKHEGKDKGEGKKDKKKEAFISKRAQDPIKQTTDVKETIKDLVNPPKYGPDAMTKPGPAPTPAQKPELDLERPDLGVDLTKNTQNIRGDISNYSDLKNAWAILAPFLPDGAYLSSGWRSDNQQAKIILEYWLSATWPRGKKTWSRNKGFFHTNFKGPSTEALRWWLKLAKSAEPISGKRYRQLQRDIEPLRKIMTSYSPSGKVNEPPVALQIAKLGTSAHLTGTAFDVSGARLGEIVKAAKYVMNIFRTRIQFIDIRPEKGHRAVHLEVEPGVTMPDEFAFTHALWNYQNPIKSASAISKRSSIPQVERFVDILESKYFGSTPIPTPYPNIGMKSDRDSSIMPKVKLNDVILAAWKSLKPHLPKGAKMTSGARTYNDQVRIIGNYWNKSGLNKKHPEVTDPYERSKILIKNKWIVGPPTTKAKNVHLTGRAFDISGADLNEIAAAARKVSNDPNIPVSFSQIKIEQKNNAVHIGIKDVKTAEVDTDIISKLAEISVKDETKEQVSSIFEDLLKSNPPKDVLNEYKMTFSDLLDIDEEKDGFKLEGVRDKTAWRVSVDDGKVNIELSPDAPDFEISDEKEKSLSKRGPGRPKKEKEDHAEDEPPKRGRGRPRKDEQPISKRKPGRPKKVVDHKKRKDEPASDESLEVVHNPKDEDKDWFERSPISTKRKENVTYNASDISEKDVKKIVKNDPKRYFYLGLNKDKKFKKYEYDALSNVLPIDSSFYFKFNYHEDKRRKVSKLLQDAAEYLAQQNPRGFFYYHLHDKFPELGRGAIVQLIDLNPDSFFDLGLDKDYPDYADGANHARNIKDPHKMELEKPEWIDDAADEPLSVRDKNANKTISKRAVDQLTVYKDPDEETKYYKKLLKHIDKNLKTVKDKNHLKWLQRKRYETMVKIKENEGLKPTFEWVDYDKEIEDLKEELSEAERKLLSWKKGTLTDVELRELRDEMDDIGYRAKDILEMNIDHIKEQIAEYQKTPEEVESWEKYMEEQGPYSDSHAKYEATPPNPEGEDARWTPQGEVQYYEDYEERRPEPKALQQEPLKLKGSQRLSRRAVENDTWPDGKPPSLQESRMQEIEYRERDVGAPEGPDRDFEYEVDIENIEPKDVVRYFLFKHYKKPKYEKHNDRLLNRLFEIQPSKFFDIGLFEDDNFKEETGRAIFHTAYLEPEYFMKVVLPNFPDAEKYKPLAEEKIAEEKDPHIRRHELMYGEQPKKKWWKLSRKDRVQKLASEEEMTYEDAEQWAGFPPEYFDLGLQLDLRFKDLTLQVMASLSDQEKPEYILYYDLHKSNIGRIQNYALKILKESHITNLKAFVEHRVYNMPDVGKDGLNHIVKRMPLHYFKYNLHNDRTLDPYTKLAANRYASLLRIQGGKDIHDPYYYFNEYKLHERDDLFEATMIAANKLAQRKPTQYFKFDLHNDRRLKDITISAAINYPKAIIMYLQQLDFINADELTDKIIENQKEFDNANEDRKSRPLSAKRFAQSLNKSGYTWFAHVGDPDSLKYIDKIPGEISASIVGKTKALFKPFKESEDFKRKTDSRINKNLKDMGQGAPVVAAIFSGAASHAFEGDVAAAKGKFGLKALSPGMKGTLTEHGAGEELENITHDEAWFNPSWPDNKLVGFMAIGNPRHKDYNDTVMSTKELARDKGVRYIEVEGNPLNLPDALEEWQERGGPSRRRKERRYRDTEIPMSHRIEEFPEEMGLGNVADRQHYLSKRAADPLSTYKKKRQFNETPEPEGKAEGKNQHRFVIQRHKAKKAGEHFDLRLENDDGTMSSWAIPKHKLPSKGEKLLATKTEDHPISYNKFKGEIPEGEYGAGTVDIHDSGKYEEIKWSGSTIKFKLNGKKESGLYTLHKTDGKRWLLMQGKEDNSSKKESSLSIRAKKAPKIPPKKWWDKMVKRIQKANPDYDEERVAATIGEIWYNNISAKKRSEISKRDRKKGKD